MANAGVTVLPEGAVFVGKFRTRDAVVEGRFEGTLDAQGQVRIGPSGVMKGRLRGTAVEVAGEFEGEIRAATLVFGAGARARGVFSADRLTVREGAMVNGAFPRTNAEELKGPWPEEARAAR